MNKDFLKGFKQGTHAFGNTIAIIVNSALLAVVYVIGVGLTALGCKIFKKRFLDVKPDHKAKSYWAELNLKKRKIEEHYRQF